jgi:hypothetical protein
MMRAAEDRTFTEIRPVTGDEAEFYRTNGWVKLPALLPVTLTQRLLEVA